MPTVFQFTYPYEIFTVKMNACQNYIVTSLIHCANFLWHDNSNHQPPNLKSTALTTTLLRLVNILLICISSHFSTSLQFLPFFLAVWCSTKHWLITTKIQGGGGISFTLDTPKFLCIIFFSNSSVLFRALKNRYFGRSITEIRNIAFQNRVSEMINEVLQKKYFNFFLLWKKGTNFPLWKFLWKARKVKIAHNFKPLLNGSVWFRSLMVRIQVKSWILSSPVIIRNIWLANLTFLEYLVHYWGVDPSENKLSVKLLQNWILVQIICPQTKSIPFAKNIFGNLVFLFNATIDYYADHNCTESASHLIISLISYT